MELRVLRYFLAVAREQNISGAAEILHISQPTLSRQLMDLEEKFGKKLFIRGNRRITLTDEGILLQKRAEEIIDLADKTEAELMSSENAISGDIYIGSGETKAMQLIAEIIKEFQLEYPDVKFHIHSGNAQDVSERLDKGLLDFGVLIASSDIGKYEFLRMPATDRWGVLMKKDAPLAQKDTIVPDDLRNLPLICSRQMMKEQNIRAWIKSSEEKLNIVATYNLIYNASLLVAADVGYAICLDKLIKVDDGDMLCFRPIEPSVELHLDFVWKKYQVFSKAAELFLKRIQKSF